jgi:16S rRNA A1518/A1519 N6-dimethyltransferase RsmA/KsgA/DIM1 with predicted DNA glycosylase/AP lyase activity
VLLKPWFEPSILYHFRPGDFAPAPRVDVVMLRLRKRGPPLVSAREAQSYRDFVVHAFTAPRPNLRGALRRLFGRREFDEIGRRLELKRDTIPSGVSFERWLTLYYCYTLLATPATKQEVEGAERRLRERQQGLEKMHRTRVASTGRGIGR